MRHIVEWEKRMIYQWLMYKCHVYSDLYRLIKEKDETECFLPPFSLFIVLSGCGSVEMAPQNGVC